MCSSEKVAAWKAVLAEHISKHKGSIICEQASREGSVQGCGGLAAAAGAKGKVLLYAEQQAESMENVEAMFPAAETCERHSRLAQGFLPMVSLLQILYAGSCCMSLDSSPSGRKGKIPRSKAP